MLGGERLQASTAHSALHSSAFIIARKSCAKSCGHINSTRRQLTIRCARQKPQRPGKAPQVQTNVPSRSLGEDYGSGDSFSDNNPDHRAGYVAIVGKPNAGKSTLLNAIMRQKLSIVTSKAQTTRHRIIAAHSEDDFQCIFLDTPGVLRPVTRPEDRSKLDERMMQSVKRASKDADAMLVIIDASDRPAQTLTFLASTFEDAAVPLAVVLNKVDLLFGNEVEEAAQVFRDVPKVEAVIPVAAATGHNVKAVEDWAVSHLPLGPALYPKDTVSEHPERFFVGEIIREKIFQLYQQEVPYCTTVQINDFKERDMGKDLVSATVFVEQDSQKGILIGRGGAALKQLGSAARTDIEDFLGRPVFLDMTVKVKEKWRKSNESLNEFGY